ncbi:MAG: hypothetical protein LBE04_02250 [Prevotellaceae bacterium]|jgi:hypothetical protein|nr:hypothetical protein [Prevotellaceae bacterium]
MKTSNILIITYLFVIFSGLAVLYIDDKQHYVEYKRQKEEQRQKHIRTSKLYESKVDLPKFTVIADTSGGLFLVTSGKSNELTVVDTVNEISPGIFDVRNDTLYINRIPKISDSIVALYIVCADLKSIVARNSKSIILTNVYSDLFSLKLTKSRLSISDSYIDKFDLDLNDDSYCNIKNVSGKVLNYKCYNSHIEQESSHFRRSFGEQSSESLFNMSVK